MKLEFDRFFKNTHILNFIKIDPVGAKLFHVDGQTDMMKLSHFFTVVSMRLKEWDKAQY